MDTIDSDLKTAIQEALDSGWSYNRIAKECGIPDPVLNRWCNGKRTITIETAQKICNWFGKRLTKGRVPKCK